mgnify:CR=1 FL=1
MKIEFTKTVAGNFFLYKKGKQYHLPAKQALQFIKADFAFKIEEKETATNKPARKRTTRKKSK